MEFSRTTWLSIFPVCQACPSMVSRFLAASIALVVSAPNLQSLVSVNSEAVIQIFFGMNLLGVVSIVFIAAQFFASQLDDELKRSEELLLNILPPSIAKRLKQGDDPIVDNFDGGQFYSPTSLASPKQAQVSTRTF